MVMSYGYGISLRKLALIVFGGVFGSALIAAPLLAAHLFAAHPARQEAPDQTKSGQSQSEQAKPDQTAQTQGTSQPTPAAAANSPSGAKAPEQIVVPAGTRLPLLLHNGITTRNAQPGEPLYLET